MHRDTRVTHKKKFSSDLRDTEGEKWVSLLQYLHPEVDVMKLLHNAAELVSK